MWYDTFGPGFFIAVTGTFFGFCGLVVRAALRSNCQEVSCCFGLTRCVRGEINQDVQLESPNNMRRIDSRGVMAPPNTPQSLTYATSL